MVIQESAENYLEAILVLFQKKGHVRSIDVANHLGFSKPSVSVAMKQLRENGYVVVDDEGLLQLTESGLEIASRIYERHLLISEFLINIGVDKDIAYADACRIEHDLSPESFAAMKSYFSKISKHEEK